MTRYCPVDLEMCTVPACTGEPCRERPDLAALARCEQCRQLAELALMASSVVCVQCRPDGAEYVVHRSHEIPHPRRLDVPRTKQTMVIHDLAEAARVRRELASLGRRRRAIARGMIHQIGLVKAAAAAADRPLRNRQEALERALASFAEHPPGPAV